MKSVERVGIEPGGQPVGRHLEDVLAIVAGVGVVGGERVPVHDRVEALVRVLQRAPSCRGRP